jgi:hypothetical protein
MFGLVIPASVADWGLSVKEEYLAANPGTTLSMVGIALVLGAIGLYVGLMLRKPKKN